MNKPKPDTEEILKALKTLKTAGGVIELRLLHKNPKRTESGFFDEDHWEEMVQAAIKGNEKGTNVYFNLNPIKQELFDLCPNKTKDYAKTTVSDSDVIRRCWLLIDLDPDRPAGTAATEEQYRSAKKTVLEIHKFLAGLEWPAPVVAISGNGGHLLFKIDLPNDNESRDLVKAVLDVLDKRFGTGPISVDRSVFNAARITKLYGTVSTKGDHSEDAPWRLSRLVSVPEEIKTVTVEQLKALASEHRPVNMVQNATALNSSFIAGIGFDLDSFLKRLGIPYQKDRHEERDRYKLDHCPFNPEHGWGEAAIFRDDNSVLGFKCMHNSCADKHWRDVRELVDESKADYSETPLLFDEASTPEIPSDLLPGCVGEHVKAVARSTQTPTVMAFLMSLSAVATCTAKRFKVGPYPEGYTEPLNLWTATAMPPASRKTAVVQAVTGPLVEWERNEAERLALDIQSVNQQRQILEQRIKNLEKTAADTKDLSKRAEAIQEITSLNAEMPPEIIPPRLWTADVTPERLQGLLVDHGERLSVLSDEGGIFEVMAGLYSDGKANVDIFLQSHAGQAARIDRQGRTAHLDSPALSFGLTIQPAILSNMMTAGNKRFRNNGTLARFLYAVPRSNVGSRDVRAVYQIPASLTAKYRTMLFSLLSIPPQIIEGNEVPRRLTLNAEALECWLTFAAMIEKRQGPDGDLESISDWSGKLPGAALRIAGNFHLIEHGTNPLAQIEVHTVKNAVQLCTLLIDHAKAAFNLMEADQVTSDAKLIYGWIIKERLAHFKKSEAYRHFKARFTGKADRFSKALHELEERSIMAKTTEPTAGRSATVYIINNALCESA